MIARLLRLLWCATLLVLTGSAWASIHWFGHLIGPGFAAWLGILPWLLLHPLAVAANFLLSRRFGDPVPPAERLSPTRALRMLDCEIDASVRGFWFANPFLERRAAPVGHVTRRHPILFVHGYFCNRAVWHSFMRDAAQRGYRCEAVTLAAPFGPIEDHASTIAAALAALDPSGAPAFIVAHSMGGLAVRSALRSIECARVAHVVTLGSPHHGTWSARFGRGAALGQMRRGSAWLAALDADERAGGGLPRRLLTSIRSRHDDIVYPQSTARLDGSEDVVIGGCGHVALLYDATVRTLVFERLERLDRLDPAHAAHTAASTS